MKVSCGLDFILVEDGKAYISGVGSCTDEHLVIPSTYNGFPVVGICEKAFCRNNRIKSVALPCSVAHIADQAFAWCRNLEKVQFSAVEEIGNRAFTGCDKLVSVITGDFLTYIGDKAFAYCPAINSVTLPDSLRTIGISAFEGCRGLNSITLSNRIKVIESGTFYACENLRQIKIPHDLSYIDDLAFAYCTSLSDVCLPSHTLVNTNAFFECENILNNKVS